MARTTTGAIAALSIASILWACGDDDTGDGPIDASTGADVRIPDTGAPPDAPPPSDAAPADASDDGGPVLVTCRADGDCPASAPACNESVGVCVDCNDDAQCAAPEPYCSEAGFCLECRTDDHCRAPTPVCGQLFGCVECLEHTDCPAERPQCDLPPRGYRCLPPCTGDADCVGAGRGPLCDETTGICVACFTDADCPGAGAVCAGNECRGPR